MILKLFKYIEPMWLGSNNKVSIRRVLTLIFSFNLILNISRTLNNPILVSSYADVAMLLGIEAGLIAALMSLTTYSNSVYRKTQNNIDIPQEDQ
jgi:hypothetical protein